MVQKVNGDICMVVMQLGVTNCIFDVSLQFIRWIKISLVDWHCYLKYISFSQLEINDLKCWYKKLSVNLSVVWVEFCYMACFCWDEHWSSTKLCQIRHGWPQWFCLREARIWPVCGLGCCQWIKKGLGILLMQQEWCGNLLWYSLKIVVPMFLWCFCYGIAIGLC